MDRDHSTRPELTRSQVVGTLISIRNMTIQSNMPFVVPSDEVADLEFAFGETPNTPFHDTMHSDPNEERSNKVMFADEGGFVDAP